MEVVLLLVVLTGIALIVVPRMQRRRAAGKRPAPAKRQRRRGRAVAAAAPAVATTTWTPAGDDGWDDDLGWEGVEEPAPETREAWERWRETESPLAAAPEPEQPAELPSVERWRAASSEESDWVGDDDGLGWEGESEPVSTNGNGASNGNGNGKGHAEPAIVLSAFATAAEAPAGVRTARPQEAEEFDAPTGRQWRATNGAAAPAVAAPRRRARMHPVVLVAIYAAAGIGLVVLASTVLLDGGSSDPAPAVQKTTPAVKPAAPAVAPIVQDTAAQDAAAAEQAEAAVAARKAEDAFAGAQTKAERSHDSLVSKARADKRRKDREDKRDAAGSPPPTAPPSGSGTSSSGGGTYVPPRAPVVCEFCIG